MHPVIGTCRGGHAPITTLIQRRRCASVGVAPYQARGAERSNAQSACMFHRRSPFLRAQQHVCDRDRQQRRLRPGPPSICCASAAPATAAALCSAAAQTEWMFRLGTLYALPFFLLMILAPHSRVTQQLTASEALFIPLTLLYGVLLWRSWTPDTLSLMMPGSLAAGFAGGRLVPQFFPTISGITSLFSQPATAASLWIHLLCINLFAARWAYRDGLRKNIPTRLSIMVAMTFGPLGVLSHFITQAMVAIWRGGYNRGAPNTPRS